ncbi:MAG: thiamine pyrophosphate-dependent enzyme [Myxococcota bacterium]
MMSETPAERVQPDPQPRTLSVALAQSLLDAGCRRAFGILGGASVPLFSALASVGLAPLHARHEGGAVFMALEHELAGGGPGVVLTTTGPGLTNALTGVEAARSEGGRIIVLSALTGGARRGRHSFQASDPQSLRHRGLYADGGWFDMAVALEAPEQLPVALSRLRDGLRRPQGFVAHIAVPLSLQEAPAPAMGFVSAALDVAPSEACGRRVAEALGKRTVVWVGHGARGAAQRVRALVDRIDARVMCSPRGKGIFPASDPRFLGVTGFGGHERVFERRDRFSPDTTLVLGSRLGEFTSFWDSRLVEGTHIVHVDVDDEAFGGAYPSVETVTVRAEIDGLLGAMLHALPARSGPIATAPVRQLRSAYVRHTGTGVTPRALMQGVQRAVVDTTATPVLAEAGNAFVWATHVLRFEEPGRFRVSMAFGSMGHMSGGVVGTALARGGPALALVGDGSMLMANEVSTAVQHDVPAIWVVLNDGRYGLVADGMQGLGHAPRGLEIPQVDFAQMAASMGAGGCHVCDPAELDAALRRALSHGGPFVVDVQIDPREPAPFGARNRSLAAQQDA